MIVWIQQILLALKWNRELYFEPKKSSQFWHVPPAFIILNDINLSWALISKQSYLKIIYIWNKFRIQEYYQNCSGKLGISISSKQTIIQII